MVFRVAFRPSARHNLPPSASTSSQLSPAHTETPSVETPETFATRAGETREAPRLPMRWPPTRLCRNPPRAKSPTLPWPRCEAARPPAAEPAQQRERAPIPGARRGADGVWEFTRLPDKDERQMLYGQKWRVVESEASRELFLGPDGEFGWDDFVDLINPLQHIPFVNMAYRAITGDQIYGAARMVDVAFGPLAGASTAVDLAFRDVTGESMAHNAIAAVFGTGESTKATRYRAKSRWATSASTPPPPRSWQTPPRSAAARTNRRAASPSANLAGWT